MCEVPAYRNQTMASSVDVKFIVQSNEKISEATTFTYTPGKSAVSIHQCVFWLRIRGHPVYVAVEATSLLLSSILLWQILGGRGPLRCYVTLFSGNLTPTHLSISNNVELDTVALSLCHIHLPHGCV